MAAGIVQSAETSNDVLPEAVFRMKGPYRIHMEELMHITRLLPVVGVALAAIALAGCAAQTPAASSPSASHTSTSAGSAYGSTSSSYGTPNASNPMGAGGSITTASTSLGTIIVDGTGLTAYYYDKDTPGAGTSACTGGCAAAWPAIEAGTTKSDVVGVTGKIGTITGVDGKPQITINGRPIYTYAEDTKPGGVTGEGVGGVWYAVNPDGSEHK
ncbi:hypothetical protein [Curtobacterium sp. SORGH_AS_0776]|uniref:COG4315 family predicted lipoprotein n=1 Tax=Curtobacterium sp. SORGH_AS_0776 TaxID=3041798 RepID=UPI00286006A8|nr:hypothetical protein [Curtobacterium sp. SORGH_AS_0776]MDR6170419.1 putative lipoprotein with Yx(FWY)xxD motif [Curtobacterium sp. SORGH_AS_0776]